MNKRIYKKNPEIKKINFFYLINNNKIKILFKKVKKNKKKQFQKKIKIKYNLATNKFYFTRIKKI